MIGTFRRINRIDYIINNHNINNNNNHHHLRRNETTAAMIRLLSAGRTASVRRTERSSTGRRHAAAALPHQKSSHHPIATFGTTTTTSSSSSSGSGHPRDAKSRPTSSREGGEQQQQQQQQQQRTWKTFPDGSRFWKDIGGGHHQRPIFVAATRQHVGKTTTSLAIMSGLQKRFEKVGFIKPVGQQHVEVKSGKGDDETLRVDKDVCLVKEHFHLDQ